MRSSATTGTELNRTEVRAATLAGIVIAVLGVLALVFPFVTGISLAVLLGVVLVVGALVHAAHAFSRGSLGSVLWQVVLAVLYGAAGISFVANPVVGLATLTLLAIGFFVANGLVEVAWGLRNRGRPGALWLLASGGISFLLAGSLWFGFPISAIWGVGVLLGLNLLATGISMIRFGRGARQPVAQDVAQGNQS